MKQVIRIPDSNSKEGKVLKPVEFTHVLDIEVGFTKTEEQPNEFDSIVYLGNCLKDGDMFATYYGGYIGIFKGHLNDGVY